MTLKCEMALRLERITPINHETLKQAQACAALDQPMEIFGKKWQVVYIKCDEGQTPEIGLCSL